MAVAVLWTKLSHVVVAQTSNVRVEPNTGGTAATDEAEMRAREAPTTAGCCDRIRSRSRSPSWKAMAADGALSSEAWPSCATEADGL